MEWSRSFNQTGDSESSFSSSSIKYKVLHSPLSKREENNLECDVKHPSQASMLDLNGHSGTTCSVMNTQENGHLVQNTDEFVHWPKKDFEELLKRIESVIPNNDRLAYNTQVDKINWDLITFRNYTSETCKKAWQILQKKIRKFRLFTEVLSDAKELLQNSWPSFLYHKNKHPDMPKRPMTAYMIYYMKNKDKLLLENPGIELCEVAKKIGFMYKNLPDTKKEKYTSLASEEFLKYGKKLGDFYKYHPEIPYKNTIDSAPKKPYTPFCLFYEQHFVKYKPNDDEKGAFKEKYKRRWKNLSDKKKLKWIDYALEKEAEYKVELQKYIINNPGYTATTGKPILTKEEKVLKDKSIGKPIKPPISAYALFSQIMMQSDDIKKIDVKYRLKTVAGRWKMCTLEEKNLYKEHADNLRLQYNHNYTIYLETLPEDQRILELQNNLKKRKKNNDSKSTAVPSISSEKSTKTNMPSKKKKKIETITNFESSALTNDINENTSTCIHKISKGSKIKKMIQNNSETARNSDVSEIIGEKERKFKEILDTEPPAPPTSTIALYGCCYKGRGSVEVAWQKLNEKKKLLLHQELKQIKEQYIMDYELFLTRFDENQLQRFAKLKKIEREKSEIEK